MIVARALLVVVAVAGALGCETATSISRRGELDVALSRHHVDVRWGRVPLAARNVHPDLQAAFVEDWERRAKEIDITEVEVLQVFELDDGKKADVVVRYAWIERKTQSLHEATLTESWEEVDGAWLMVKTAIPPDQP